MEDFLVWPVTIAVALVVLGITFLLTFRKPIARLLERTKRAGKDGFEFEGSQEAGGAQVPHPLSYEELMKRPVSATVRATEERTAAEVEQFKPKDDTQRAAMLLRYLALLTVANEFSNIHANIFGSQMEVMVALVGRKTPLPREAVEAIYEEARKTHPEFHKNTNFGDWLRFLVNVGLVEVSSETVDLTQRGKDFMLFLVESRTATPRPG